jgi:hypothetical protein
VHSAFYGELSEDEFYPQMILTRRLIIQLRVARVYGIAMDSPPGG